MPFFYDHYPYTNFHNVNLDWILQAVKAWGEMVEQNNQNFINLDETMTQFRLSLQADWLNYQDTINNQYAQWSDNIYHQWVVFWNEVRNYLHDLDVSQEISDKIDEMATNGELASIINPTITNTVTSWLNTNVTPTTPVIDRTLKILGAGADSKITGYLKTVMDSIQVDESAPLPYERKKEITYALTWTSGTHSGITYTLNNDVMTVSGTASNFSFRNICGSTSAIPTFFKTGRRYCINFNSTDSNIYLHLNCKASGTDIKNVFTNSSPLVFTIPKNATSLLLRLVIEKGTTVDGTFAITSISEYASAYLNSTNDTTDRTNEIESLLNDTGLCVLGEGVFYVKNVDMAQNSSIIGNGKNSIIRLIDANDSIYALATNNNCSISNLTIEGSDNDITLSDNTNISRHGIYHCKTGTVTIDNANKFLQIDNVFIRRFTGSGIYNENSGTPVDAGMCVTNCRISNCNVGINIPYSGEYNKYNCVDITRCYYGFINNGSSNVFVGGSISTCNIGIYADRETTTPNAGHCIFSGCTLNHFNASDGTLNTGVIIELINTINFTFDNCNMAYGNINLNNCSGIIITSTQVGAETYFNINGGNTILFTDNMSRQLSDTYINITNNNYCFFHNNYTRYGSAWTQNT